MALVKTKEVIQPSDDDTQFLFTSDEISDMVICKSPEKLQLLINSLKINKQVFYVSDGDWSMHDLVMCLLTWYKPADLYFTTYAIRELPIRQLIMAQDRGELSSINMILDYRAKTRTPEVFQLANMNANKVVLTNIHAKVTVLKSDAGSITIVGSSNWTANPRIEAGVVNVNEALADFHIKWMKKLLNNAEVFE